MSFDIQGMMSPPPARRRMNDEPVKETTDIDGARYVKIIIWKAQGVPQLNNVAHPKHPEEEETLQTKNT